SLVSFVRFFFRCTACPSSHLLSLHDALPISVVLDVRALGDGEAHLGEDGDHLVHHLQGRVHRALAARRGGQAEVEALGGEAGVQDRKSTCLNSSHVKISYAVFCLKKKKERAD